MPVAYSCATLAAPLRGVSFGASKGAGVVKYAAPKGAAIDAVEGDTEGDVTSGHRKLSSSIANGKDRFGKIPMDVPKDPTKLAAVRWERGIAAQ